MIRMKGIPARASNVRLLYLMFSVYIFFQVQFPQFPVKNAELLIILLVGVFDFARTKYDKKVKVPDKLSIVLILLLTANSILFIIQCYGMFPTALEILTSVLSCVILGLLVWKGRSCSPEILVRFVLCGSCGLIFIAIKKLVSPDLLSLYGELLIQPDRIDAYLILFTAVTVFLGFYYEEKKYEKHFLTGALFSQGLMLLSGDAKLIALLFFQMILIPLCFKWNYDTIRKYVIYTCISLFQIADLNNILNWMGFSLPVPSVYLSLICEGIAVIMIGWYFKSSHSKKTKTKGLLPEKAFLAAVFFLQLFLVRQTMIVFPVFLAILLIKYDIPAKIIIKTNEKILFFSLGGLVGFYFFLTGSGLMISPEVLQVTSLICFAVFMIYVVRISSGNREM
ncbi:MAG: hypothetical protein NC081_01475 [Roseburia sp.]|nr:hypothetical protein [Roseburia sp.]